MRSQVGTLEKNMRMQITTKGQILGVAVSAVSAVSASISAAFMVVSLAFAVSAFVSAPYLLVSALESGIQKCCISLNTAGADLHAYFWPRNEKPDKPLCRLSIENARRKKVWGGLNSFLC